ncbi:sensor histidine kinase [Marinomonas posidonica]|uniref:histidine kinase n=1 Tax=Marinomonas posidonica (strain CECT 7376 / NCIMB 14433 / IVIA-Po-181) TaxID=491952 RepID=F6CX99_MARPP|nr:HAMP domain-containing sensor histidine kinase [Marinomonas posidonica]AEF54452.1 integral membrane sensor signal transduction histidine kinase [Marinomonas posidonica IVIA-Po-181]
MKRIKTAKQLTFTYFSIVAFAIIAFHFSMFQSVIENVEMIYAENRMVKDKNVALERLQGTSLTHVSIPPFSEVYVGQENLPLGVVLDPNMTDDVTYELDEASDTDLEVFSMRSQVTLNGQQKTLYIIHYDEIYESSETQMFHTQSTQLMLSLLLLVVSLWVVMQISMRLTKPLSQLSQFLTSRRPDDLTPIALPEGAATREVHLLVACINDYQQQIQALIERERAFNRYASHELRTPLMVMKGAVTLLGKTDSPSFIKRQQVRMHQACQEMEDYISTLLSLTREEDLSTIPKRSVTQAELESIKQAHMVYLTDGQVSVQIQMENRLEIKLPEPVFHILIGNLLKNAMASTEKGRIDIQVVGNQIDVIDTGCGLSGKPGGESYGLGLMIVRDICVKYACEFSLQDNVGQGCTARLVFT